MGRMFMEDIKEQLGKEQGLRVHLQANFYPPLPGDVQEIIIEEFKKHWEDGCHWEMLLERINRRLKKNNGKIVGMKSLDHFDGFILEEHEIIGKPPKKKNPWAFPKAKVKRIVKSVGDIFKNKNIDCLTHEAYEFIHTKMGFIAHYDLFGFRDYYRGDLQAFAKGLLYGEGSIRGYDAADGRAPNEREAGRQENDSDFRKWYGKEYCVRSAEVFRSICKIARTYYKKEE